MRSRISERLHPLSEKFQVFVLSSIFVQLDRPRRSLTYYAILFSFFFIAFGCHNLSTDPKPPILDSLGKVMRVASSGDYAPFSHWPAGGPRPSGFSTEVAKAYAEDHGLEIRWIRFRWSELATDLEAGAFDIALSGITVRPDRSAKGRFSLPLTTSGAIALVHETGSLHNSADLDQPGIRIAVNAGGHLERVAKRLFPAATLRPIADNGNVLEELLLGRADAVLTDSLEAPLWRQSAGSELRAIGPFTHDRKAAWFSIANAKQAKHFNRWLLRAEAKGQLAALRVEYGLPEGRTASALPALLSSLDERLTLMPAVAEAKQVLGVATENSAREELVLDAASRNVLRSAEEAGVDPPNPASIRRLFRTQIEAAKWIQDRRREELDSTTADSKSPSEEAARNELEKVIRPSLIYLGDRISMLLIACTETAIAPLTFVDVSEALRRHDLPDKHLRAIFEALTDILYPRQTRRYS